MAVLTIFAAVLAIIGPIVVIGPVLLGPKNAPDVGSFYAMVMMLGLAICAVALALTALNGALAVLS
ncbi:hypothetical protein [Methylobacterium sp.]|uniref:hypothetical protein n=1 Tax=Methylobacterium sp. TaxID=409 RepID=UPI003B5B86B6